MPDSRRQEDIVIVSNPRKPAFTKGGDHMEYPVLDAKKTGARIKELRKAHHIKVEEVARFMGFESEQAVYKWQRGDSLPTVDNLYALSRLFETSVDDILRGNREEDERSSSFFVHAAAGMYST